MRYWNISASLFATTILFHSSSAQELNCSVRVNADQIALSDKRIFTDMETSFEQFLNSRKWTTDTYRQVERIKCNINVTIDKMVSIGTYEATVQIQSARPIYNTNYESILLNFADREWQFDYTESQPMDFVETRFENNLTSLLAYYAFIVLGFDYDSFSELGGTPFFNKAMNVVTEAQPSNFLGWSPQRSNRNRYWLAQNLTGQALEEIRQGIYTYHRLALDTYLENTPDAQQKILEVLTHLKQLNDRNPSQILITAFVDAKTDELVNIYGDASPNVKRQAHSLLISIDPAKKNRFDKILQN
ncbi:MAG TPA: DUF4835 family protein [Cyclobacteriaceae bacterium]|jgi:hypothetical protein